MYTKNIIKEKIDKIHTIKTIHTHKKAEIRKVPIANGFFK
jgi:hypothetical protein